MTKDILDIIKIVREKRPLIVSSFKVDREVVEEYATSLVKLLTTPFISLGFTIKFINTIEIKNPTEIAKILDQLLMKIGESGLKINITTTRTTTATTAATTTRRTLLLCYIESCNASIFTNYMLTIIIYIVDDVIHVFLY